MKPFANDTGTKFVNSVKYALPEHVGKDGTYRDSHAGFAFLLDYVPNWRLMYGEGGFIQVQLFVPDRTARDAFAEALRLCQRRGVVSYLGVFKRPLAFYEGLYYQATQGPDQCIWTTQDERGVERCGVHGGGRGGRGRHRESDRARGFGVFLLRVEPQDVPPRCEPLQR